METRQFYQKAIGQVTDAGIRKLLGDLEEVERKHQVAAEAMSESITQTVKKTEEEAQRRLFVLQIVQPGLAGLMDGSVSTLAPVFAAAFATRNSHDAFLVGLAASIGAGISMAFAEALSDDGSLTGRGRPVLRGAVTGLMTAAGGIGHAPVFADEFPCGVYCSGNYRGGGVSHDCMDSESIHGHSAALGGVSGGGGRSAGVCGGDMDWEFVREFVIL